VVPHDTAIVVCLSNSGHSILFYSILSWSSVVSAVLPGCLGMLWVLRFSALSK
jgi:hypothetical protein